MTPPEAPVGTASRRAVMLAAAYVGVAFYALLALSSGLDRIAGSDDSAVVPTIWPFHAGAARAAARTALLAHSPGAALAEAREAVRQDPIDARGIGLLGQAALQNGDAALAGRAFAVGTRLGWREPLTQAYALQASLTRGDYHTAADHLDALLRQSPDFAGRNLLLAPFDAAPAGRAELAARLAAKPAWAQAYFADTAAAASGDPLARTEVAERLGRAGLRECGLVAPVMAGLLKYGHYAQARSLHALHCEAAARTSAAALPVDGEFSRANLAHPPTALDWRFTDEGAISASFTARTGFPGRAVIVGSAAPNTLAFAEQPMMVGPGTVVIAWRARDASAAPSPAIEVALTCDADGSPWLAKALVDRGAARYQATVTIPPGCARQRLVLGIAGGASDIAVGDIRLTATESGPLRRSTTPAPLGKPAAIITSSETNSR